MVQPLPEDGAPGKQKPSDSQEKRDEGVSLHRGSLHAFQDSGLPSRLHERTAVGCSYAAFDLAPRRTRPRAGFADRSRRTRTRRFNGETATTLSAGCAGRAWGLPRRPQRPRSPKTSRRFEPKHPPYCFVTSLKCGRTRAARRTTRRRGDTSARDGDRRPVQLRELAGRPRARFAAAAHVRRQPSVHVRPSENHAQPSGKIKRFAREARPR